MLAFALAAALVVAAGAGVPAHAAAGVRVPASARAALLDVGDYEGRAIAAVEVTLEGSPPDPPAQAELASRYGATREWIGQIVRGERRAKAGGPFTALGSGRRAA